MSPEEQALQMVSVSHGELEALHEERQRMLELLREVEEELVERMDTVDGKDGQPRPNFAMKLVTRIREVLP